MIALGISMFALLGFRGALAAQPPELARVYEQARTYDRATFRYVRPSPERLERARALGAALAETAASADPELLRARLPRLAAAAAAAGLALTEARDAGGTVWAVAEPAGRREGSGLYAIRPGGAAGCIQAPHTFHDERTGRIALGVFAALRSACAAFNTVHRYAPAADGARGVADVAHAPGSVFAAVLAGALERARWPVVQLHGFAARPELDGVAAVVSSGAAEPGPAAARLQAALARELGEPVRLFGRDTRALGATTNVEGAAARAAGVPFVHVELSAPARRRLAADPRPLSGALDAALRGGREATR